MAGSWGPAERLLSPEDCRTRHGTERSAMYKNLSPSAIGVFGRQSELVEIALTHRFKGLEIDITEVLRRAQTTSMPQACRYLSSAPMKIGGFELPVRWASDEKEFQTDLAQVGLLLEVLHDTRSGSLLSPRFGRPAISGRSTRIFKFHVERLRQVADALAPGNVRARPKLLCRHPAIGRTAGLSSSIRWIRCCCLSIRSSGKTWVWCSMPGAGAWAAATSKSSAALRGEQVISVRLADIPAGVDLGGHHYRAAPDARRRRHDRRRGTRCACWTRSDYDGPVAVAPIAGSVRRARPASRSSARLLRRWTRCWPARGGERSRSPRRGSNRSGRPPGAHVPLRRRTENHAASTWRSMSPPSAARIHLARPHRPHGPARAGVLHAGDRGPLSTSLRAAAHAADALRRAAGLGRSDANDAASGPRLWLGDAARRGPQGTCSTRATSSSARPPPPKRCPAAGGCAHHGDARTAIRGIACRRARKRSLNSWSPCSELLEAGPHAGRAGLCARQGPGSDADSQSCGAARRPASARA